MPFGYQDARDFFGAVRQAAIETGRYERNLERMESAEGVRAQGYGPTARGTATRGMGATDARIDYEARMEPIMARNYDLIGDACRVLYGDGNDGGLYALAGHGCADALWWRCCCAKSWAETADMLSSSVSTARRWADVGMDVVDGMGTRSAIGGMGAAEG